MISDTSRLQPARIRAFEGNALAGLALLADDRASAERELRAICAFFESTRNRTELATRAADLAEFLDSLLIPGCLRPFEHEPVRKLLVLAHIDDLPDAGHATRIVARLLVAATLGGLLGYERERAGKAAGLRTHMLVALGAALFVAVGQQTGATTGDLSRVVQGIAVGIGFLGAGAILKLQENQEIYGLTTAAGIWFTAAVGLAAGTGRLATAAVGTLLAVIILSFLLSIERRIHGGGRHDVA